MKLTEYGSVRSMHVIKDKTIVFQETFCGMNVVSSVFKRRVEKRIWTCFDTTDVILSITNAYIYLYL